MDQATINLLAGAVIAALGWFARMLWERQETHSKELSEFKVFIVGSYVTGATFQQVMGELRGDLRYIRDRLDETPQRRAGDH